MPDSDNRGLSQVTQQALARSEALLRIASRLGRLGGWEFDVTRGQVHWSEETRKIHDVPADMVPTLEQAIEFYHPQDRQRVRDAVERCIRDGTAYDQELRVCTAKGRNIWVRVIGEAVRAEDGAVVTVHGAIQDITERKQAEQSVRATEERFRQFADEMPFLMWTADGNGLVDYSNRYLFEYTGADPDSPADMRWRDVVHPDDLGPSIELWSQAVVSGKPFATDLRLRRASDGTYRWFRIQAVLTRDAAGAPLKWHGSAIEVHTTKLITQEATQLAQRLKTTLESITDAFYTLDLEWRFTYLNATAERLLERSASELLGECVWKEFPATRDTILEREYRDAMSRQQTTVFQMFYEPLDRWFDVRAYPSDEGLAVYFQDVTKKHKDEELLRLLHTCVASVNEFIMITEADSTEGSWPRIVFINDAYLRHAGYSRDEVIGNTPGLLHGPDTQPDVLERIRVAVATKQPVSEELIIYTKAGEAFWSEVNIAPVADETGRVTHLMAIERDITERKRAEQRLRESEERFRFLSEATSDAIWDWDLVTGEIWWSAGFEKLWGRPIKLAGMNINQWQEQIHPDDRERVMASVQQAIDGGHTCWSAEYRFLRHDGSQAYVLDRGSIVRDVQGKATRMVGGMTDQTARKRAEQEIRRLNEVLEDRVRQRTAELESANKELEAFSYSVSHDLLSPLRSIDSFSLIVLEDYEPKLDDEGKRLLNIIRGEAQRMAQLIHDLLNFAKTGRQPIRAETCNLAEIAKAAFDSIPPGERAHVKRFELRQLPLVEGDPAMLRVVLFNLIANAVKFTRHQPEAAIEVGGRREAQQAIFYVKDNGVGFDPRYMQKLFRVFQRLHSEEEFEGTGVGLAIVQRIINRHGGQVWADAQPDLGATLYFSLPLKRDAAK